MSGSSPAGHMARPRARGRGDGPSAASTSRPSPPRRLWPMPTCTKMAAVSGEAMPGRKAAAAARAALARGDLLSAYDQVRRTAGPADSTLDYLEVLTLARLGDHARALHLYE